MPTPDTITLLKIENIPIKGVEHLEKLLTYHKDQLSLMVRKLDDPRAMPTIQAIAHNIVRLTREIDERKKKRSPRLVVFPGGKRD